MTIFRTQSGTFIDDPPDFSFMIYIATRHIQVELLYTILFASIIAKNFVCNNTAGVFNLSHASVKTTPYVSFNVAFTQAAVSADPLDQVNFCALLGMQN